MRRWAWAYASIIGLVGAFAIFEFAHQELGVGIPAAVVLAITAGIPLLGNLFAAYAAVKVWAWSWELAIGVFIISVFLASKGAQVLEERGQRRGP
jgi:hypothetical protein